MMYGLEAMKNSIVRAENAARRAAEAKKRAGSDSARENELNYRILRNIREESEAEARARLFAALFDACMEKGRPLEQAEFDALAARMEREGPGNA